MPSFDPITAAGLDAVVDAASGLVAIDFWTPGCTRCQALEAVLTEVVPDQPVVVFQSNVAEDPELAARYRVMSVPALAFYRDGEHLRTVFGEKSRADVVALIEELS
jgi:thioredoxin 1